MLLAAFCFVLRTSAPQDDQTGISLRVKTCAVFCGLPLSTPDCRASIDRLFTAFQCDNRSIDFEHHIDRIVVAYRVFFAGIDSVDSTNWPAGQLNSFIHIIRIHIIRMIAICATFLVKTNRLDVLPHATSGWTLCFKVSRPDHANVNVHKAMTLNTTSTNVWLLAYKLWGRQAATFCRNITNCLGVTKTCIGQWAKAAPSIWAW